jgi:hypothetical protein
MKKNFNVIQIKGFRGIIMAFFIVTCLVAGFIVFPGWLCMQIWNIIASYTLNVPSIALLQGVLLWGIIAATYFIFRKEKVVVCMRGQEGLSEEELKAVFANIKRQSQEDPFLQAMMRAREAELNIKTLEEVKPLEEETKTEVVEASTTETTTQL